MTSIDEPLQREQKCDQTLADAATMPPRDPNDDEDDDEEENEDQADELPVVREPDED
jgi:hypothetical protein